MIIYMIIYYQNTKAVVNNENLQQQRCSLNPEFGELKCWARTHFVMIGKMNPYLYSMVFVSVSATRLLWQKRLRPQFKRSLLRR